MKRLIWCLAVAASLLLAASAEAQKKGNPAQPKVYRWVDENGEVHYSESLPPDLQEDQLDVQEKAGNTWQEDQNLQPPPPPGKAAPQVGELPRDSSGMQRPAPRYTPAQLQAKQDALLLLRYDSDQEILDAMNLEIKQLDYDRRVLATSKNSLLDAYQGNIREAAERQRAGLQVEDDLGKNIRILKQRLAANQTSLSALDVREGTIRKSFQVELDRYRNLIAAQKKAED